MTLTFPSTSPFSELLRLALGERRRSPTVEAVHRVIRVNPGLLLGEIHERLPNLSIGAVKVAASRLKRAEDVRVEGQFHQYRYFAQGDK